MDTPSLSPLDEAPVRDHVFLVCPPTLLHSQVRSLNQSEPISVSLIEFEIHQLILHRE